ncbi:MAG TPA: DUF4344 domain-containing metallopeptidase [Rhodocyclaceae bacterium]|nr:DUF4344 domain-containing metallopeptidase [Rhodocyclaceae bacterium]
MKSLAAFLFFISISAQAQLVAAFDHPMLHPWYPKINQFLRTNGPIPLTVQKCGLVNAFFDRDNGITVCEEIASDAAAHLQHSGLLNRDQETANMLISGNFLFATFHELGHAMIYRHKIPITGREEDAADEFAAALFLQSNDPRWLLGVIAVYADKANSLKGVLGSLKRSRVTDEHSLDAQRLAQLVCWGVGKSPATFTPIAVKIGMTQDRIQRCPGEYESMLRNSDILFSPAFASTQAPPAPRP